MRDEAFEAGRSARQLLRLVLAELPLDTETGTVEVQRKPSDELWAAMNEAATGGNAELVMYTLATLCAGVLLGAHRDRESALAFLDQLDVSFGVHELEELANDDE